jgi:folate-binding protein YgfZ
MNPTWKEHLLKAGAVIEGEEIRHFGNPRGELQSAQAGSIVADLSHFEVLHVSGEDARTFLQGQTTNDLRAVTETQAQLSSLCNPKGRMLTNFLLWQEKDGYCLQLPAPLREGIQQRLAKYVLRSRVEIRDISEDNVRLGVAGGEGERLLQEIFGALPQGTLGVVRHGRGTIIRLPGSRYEVVTAAEHAPTLWEALTKGCVPAGSSCWGWLEIRAGIPVILPATQEHFVPQMANFDVIGGVSFNKGCYTGQEVVTRAHYLGKVKRRLYLAHVAGDASPQPGDELIGVETPDTEKQAAGTVVNAQPSPGGGFDLLAVIHTSAAEAGDIHWKTADGPVLQLLPLPYPA